MHKLVAMIEEEGATLNVLNQVIDTSTSSEKLMFSMLGAFAEFEGDLINDRVQEIRFIRFTKKKKPSN